jgi:hypothetical protein
MSQPSGRQDEFLSFYVFFFRFVVLMLVIIKTIIFWDVMTCSQVKVYRSFRGAYYLYL